MTRWCTIGGHEVPTANAPVLQAEVCEELLARHPDTPTPPSPPPGGSSRNLAAGPKGDGTSAAGQARTGSTSPKSPGSLAAEDTPTPPGSPKKP